MKKLVLIATMSIAIAGCGSDTDKVKNGILEFNKTITVGQALDNWKSCQSKNWEEFSAENGVKVVQFTCNHKINEYIEKVKSGVPNEINNGAIYLDVASYIEKFQFTINKDDTFQIHSVSAETKWSDGEKIDAQQKPMEELETAYSNKLSFDPEEINYLTSGQFAFAMKLVKPGEKYKTQKNNEQSNAGGSGIKCSDVKYGNDNYVENMEELAKLAGLPDAYYNRYHEDLVRDLCNGNEMGAKSAIDNGFVKQSEVESIKKILLINK